jgi:hypothetical protein
MFCYCGDCPKDIPKREEYECLCYGCAGQPQGWADVNILYTKCDKCSKMTFCRVEKKKEEEYF